MKQPETARNSFHIGMKNLKNLRKRKVLAHEYRRLMVLFGETHENELGSDTGSIYCGW